MKKILFAVLLTGIIYMHGYSQDERIEGKVVSREDSSSLGFSSIKSILTNNRAIANKDGEFILLGVPAADTLIVSRVGYMEKRVSISDLISNPLIKLTKNGRYLEEVIINTGYETLPKERATGSFEVIDHKGIENIFSTNIMQQLEGNSSIQFDKGPGRPALTVRGLSSINGNTAPLIVLDNFPFEGDINTINPDDIENITILKDAAASSIWGTRAGNGVIVITTKKGQLNKPMTVDFSSSVQVRGKPDLFALDQIRSSDVIDLETLLFNNGYYQSGENSITRPPLSPVVEILIAERDKLLSEEDTERKINELKDLDYRQDFLDHVYQNDINQQYSLSINGGSDMLTYLFSGRLDNNMDDLASEYQRINIRSFNEFSLSQRITLSAGITYSNSNRKAGRTGYSPFSSRPYYQLLDQNGDPLSRSRYRQSFIDTVGNGMLLDWNNYPYSEHEYLDEKNQVNNLLANFTGNFKVAEGINLVLLYQYENQRSGNETLYQEESYFTRDLINTFSKIDYASGLVEYGVPLGSILDEETANQYAHNGRASLSMNRSWNKHTWSALVGLEARDIARHTSSSRIYGFDEDTYTVSNVDYVHPYQNYITKRDKYVPNRSGKSLINNRFVSQFANGAYTYDRRYSISASIRRDASNLFGVKTNDKWQPLWSVGARWHVSGEDFYKSEFIPFLNLRLAYGISGNVDQTKSAVTTMRYIRPNKVTNLTAAMLQQYRNPDLRWEKSRMLNAGIDFSVKNQLLRGSLEFYHKRGEDLFGIAPIDYTAVPTRGLMRNIADMKGYGFDLSLNSRINIKSFIWEPQLVVNYFKNEVTDYYHESNLAYNHLSSGNNKSAIKGYPVYSVFSYRWAGLDQEGNPQGYLDNQKSIDYNKIRSVPMENLVYSGSAVPIFNGFFNHRFTVNRFSVFLNFSYKVGHYFKKETVKYGELLAMVALGQGSGDYARRWQRPGDESTTSVPSFIYPANSQRNQFYESSEILVAKADHIRFQNLVLGYDLHDLKIFSRNTDSQIYLNANNIGLIWKANELGIDPDYLSNGLPNPMSISLGIRLNFN